MRAVSALNSIYVQEELSLRCTRGKGMKIKTFLKITTCRERRIKKSYYIFTTKYGEYEVKFAEKHHVKKHEEECVNEEINNNQVPKKYWDMFYDETRIWNEEVMEARLSEIRMREEKEEEEKRKYQKTLDDALSARECLIEDYSILDCDIEKLESVIILKDTDYKNRTNNIRYIYEGVYIRHYFICRSEDSSQRLVKIYNHNIGMCLHIKLDINRDWDTKQYNAPYLKRKLKFAIDVVRTGKDLPCKDIVALICNGKSIPTHKTLLERGFKLTLKEYNSLDFKNIEHIKKLFNTYKK